MRIEEVSLLEDRARVTRRGVLTLRAGLNHIEVEGVAPVVVDKTLAVRLEAPEVTLVDVQVHSRARVRPDEQPERIRALRAERDELERRIARVVAEAEAAESQVNALWSTLRMAHDELSEDASWGRAPEGDWNERFDAVGSRLRSARTRSRELRDEQEELQSTLERLDERLFTLQQPSDEVDTVVRLSLESPGELSCPSELSYLVPGACWRPIHVAELMGEDDGSERQLCFRTEACIWQNTGEDWSGVKVHLSTERTSLGVAPPELSIDRLALRPKPKTVVLEAREEEVEHAGIGGGGGEVSTYKVSEVPGIQDGGLPRHFTCPSAADIPSDGRPVRVPIQETETVVEPSLVLMAELLPRVLMKTVQTNSSAQPILPGPVELIRGGGLAGRTSVPFVAPGAHFELGWGPVPELRASRREELGPAKTKAMSAWTSIPHKIELQLSNLGPRPLTVDVHERIPVSETEKLRVRPLPEETHRRQAPDRDGFLRWSIELSPFGRERILYRYIMEKHADVVGL